VAGLDAVAARSDLDMTRFVALGARPSRARVVGDLKLDAAAAPEPTAALREAIGAGPLLLAASTHPGEDERVLAAWRQLRERAPELRLALVPRHPERAAGLVELARASGAKVALRSQGAAQADVVVVDTLGELRTLYALADLVVAGGTLAPIGGHNLTEATLAGKVALAGPFVQNQRDAAALLAGLGALRRIADPGELAGALTALWEEPDRHAAARAAREVIAAHRGACERIVAWLDELAEAAHGRG
jgi:3-deoxy-D-manno-octulosonic-acid transferase